ncbi:MAG: thiamine pyrophosphate-binding protein [Syntrophobacteraceae bacterium]
MATVTGGQLVARFLKNEGVEAVFTLCGGHVMDIYNGCVDEGIRIIDVRHEQTAAHAADAWTRLTGVCGVALVTAGPGVTDAVTGVANAFRASVPMLLIGGQAPVRNLLKGGLQELNSVDLMKPISKFSATVPETARIPEFMGMALREAHNGRPGPAFLEIPNDVLDGAVDGANVAFPIHFRSKGRTRGDDKLVEAAARLIDGAKRPALLAGTQVWHCRAADRLLAFVRKTKIPTYLNGAARGCLPEDSAPVLSRSRKHALSKADLAVIVGTPFDFRLGYGNTIAPGAKIIQVDLDYAELCHNRDVDVPILGDIGAVLEQLADAASPSAGHKEWLEELRAVDSRLSQQDLPFMHSDAVPIHPLRLAREINDFLTEDTIFIADGGDVVTMAAGVVKTRKPGHWLDPGPLGTLGVGAPFAIAAKAARPESPVFVLFGDGAFGLTGFDYDTLIRFDMPVIGVVGNNAAWNQVRYAQLHKYGPERGNVANRLSPLRYDKIVEAMGGHGENVTDPAQIRPALERARNSAKPALINVMLDPEAFSASTKSLGIYK